MKEFDGTDFTCLGNRSIDVTDIDEIEFDFICLFSEHSVPSEDQLYFWAI